MRAALAMMLVIGACSNPAPVVPASSTERATEGSMTIAAHRVILPDNRWINVEVALDDASRAEGLMYRDHLAPDAGMLFVFTTDGDYPFWMKNTRIPLDMIWIDSARRIVQIKHDAPPCHVDDCPSYPPGARSRYVLEVAGGVAQAHGLKVGDVLRYEGIDESAAK